MKRGLSNSCNYATTATSTPDVRHSAASRPHVNFHDRISELEELVTTFLQGQTQPGLPTLVSRSSESPSSANLLPQTHTPDSAHDIIEPPADPGTLNQNDSGTNYVQSVHWEAILTKIRGLKEDLVAHDKVPSGSYLFYGPNRHATREELLAAVPPRPIVDRLMALHFDSYLITPCQYSL